MDLLIYRRLILEQELSDDTPAESYKGLVMSEKDALVLLNRTPEKETTEQEQLQEQYYQFSHYLASKRKKSEDLKRFLSLNYLKKTFALSRFEEECILICLAYELDRKYEKLYAYLQDDMNYKYPTIDLILNLLCKSMEEKWRAREYFLKNEKLLKFFFSDETVRDEDSEYFLTKKVRLHERIVHFILEIELSHSSSSEYFEIHYPYDNLPPLLTEQSIQKQLVDYVQNNQSLNNQDMERRLFFLSGTSGSGKTLQVKHFCHYFERSLLIVDIAEILAYKESFTAILNSIYREALLQQSIICFRDFHFLMNDDIPKTMLNKFFKRLNEFSGIVFILSEEMWQAPFPTLEKHKMIIEIEIPIPTATERLTLWDHFGFRYFMNEHVNYAQLASLFEFTPGQIERSLKTANQHSIWENRMGEIRLEHVLTACYGQVRHQLDSKAKRLIPMYKWDDLVLPSEQKESLRDACNQVKYRNIVMGQWGFEQKLSYGKGISMLFSGPPGTGKTMSAEVVANELGLEIYKVDLSQVISKYIGETEKNLKVIFEQAQLTNAILFFDETDALFGKRSAVHDAKDKYANIEVAYLLQKMEEHKGITILATNFLENIDEAFLRRISFIISFPFPEPKQREEIWRQMFPAKTPLSEEIDFPFLAEKLSLSGGSIKNIVLSAAYLAAETNESIGMKHLIKAAKHEMKKAGKILLKDDLEEYFQI